MTNQDMIDKIEDTVKFYKSGGGGVMTHMMLNEVEGQYIDMANGGDGSCVGNGEIRNKYYKEIPDSFFQAVCNRMGWKY